MNPKLLAGSALADGLAREYTLNEIAIITRAGPARLLGLAHKGHLGAGADADVTVYSRDPDLATMFSTPRYVIKGGVLVVEEGQLRRAPGGPAAARGAGIRRRGAAPTCGGTSTRTRRSSFDNYPVQALPGEPLALG